MATTPETILVPLDGSELASAAVDHAAMLATATGARLVLFTAVGGDERVALEDFASNEGIALDEAADAHPHGLGDLRRGGDRTSPRVQHESGGLDRGLRDRP